MAMAGSEEANRYGPDRREASAYPAPWRVDCWEDQYGMPRFAVKSHDHALVVTCEEDQARRIVASRNEGTVLADVASVQARWQAALEYSQAETVQVRSRWHEESAKQTAEIYRLQDEVKRLQKVVEQLHAESPPKVSQAMLSI